jgi:type I restriction enzyme S subunit
MSSSKKWGEVKVGDLGQVFTGRTPSTKCPEYFGNEFFFITPGDMHQGKHVHATERGLSDSGADLLRRIQLPAKSVCVSCIGWQMGEVVMTSAKSFTNQQINSIVPNGDVDPDFLYYSFLPRKQELLSLASAIGVRTPILNKSAFCNLRVMLPPLPTQRKIAAILSAYDDLIENNTRRIKILEEIARALYREWFVNFRFPGHEKVRMEDSELGPKPEGWDFIKLSKIAKVNESNIKNGHAPREINYVDISSVSTGKIENIQQIEFSDAPSRARRIVKHSDMIWSTVRPNRRSYCIILNPLPNLVVSTGFAVISAKHVPYTYLYHALTTDEFADYLTNNATGAAYPAVNANDFKNALVLYPPKSLLEKFHNIISIIFDQKQNLLQKNDVLRRTRDLLLPKLISGEADVSDLDIKITDEVEA